MNLVETWGDQHYIGLTGIEVLGKDGEVIDLDVSMIDAQPRDLHHLPGHEQDDRTLDKLDDICFETFAWQIHPTPFRLGEPAP